MIGTAIRNQPFGMIARGRHFSLRRGALGARTPSFLLDGRTLLSALLVFSLVLVSLACGPAAHQQVERAPSASIQLLSESAKTAGEHGAPGKRSVQGYCTGHCAAHAFALPAPFAQSVVPFARRAVWPVLDDQWRQASHPARVERPPRV